MNSRYLLVTVGHTAAGKTTLSKYMRDNPKIVFKYIEEGQIKRDIIGSYSTSDSLNENLRDEAYGIAIDRAYELLPLNNVLIDASFHKYARRLKVYEMLNKYTGEVPVIWFYCFCPNLSKVQKRIAERRKAAKAAENQADSMAIYYHIIDTFDIPDVSEIPSGIKGAIIYINTDTNIIEKTVVNCGDEKLLDEVNRICMEIERQQEVWKNRV